MITCLSRSCSWLPATKCSAPARLFLPASASSSNPATLIARSNFTFSTQKIGSLLYLTFKMSGKPARLGEQYNVISCRLHHVLVLRRRRPLNNAKMFPRRRSGSYFQTGTDFPRQLSSLHMYHIVRTCDCNSYLVRPRGL